MSKVLKEFKLSTWAIHNKMTVYVIIVMIFLAGIILSLELDRCINYLLKEIVRKEITTLKLLF
jgi:preprotein translocase subunit SecE